MNKMNKIITLTIFFIYSVFSAQISIKIHSLDEKNKENDCKDN
jgi:uncharacterized protein (DUF486 family)